MRVGVLDVGSNSVHLLVVDARAGAPPLPAFSHKAELRLAEHLEPDGTVGPAGTAALVAFVRTALGVAEDRGCERLLAFATSALRDAPNGEQVLSTVRDRTGVELRVLAGEREAELTFLAARRWFGWSAGRLLVVDIGGGSLELAIGADETPDVALSLPLGAGRLTWERFTADPPPAEEVRQTRRQVRLSIARAAGDLLRAGPPDLAVGTSKTFRQLAEACGAPPATEGIFAARWLGHDGLAARLPELAAMSAAERARLPGVSTSRAAQLLAGALVADAAMDLFALDRIRLCPWALREGVILSFLAAMAPAAVAAEPPAVPAAPAGAVAERPGLDRPVAEPPDRRLAACTDPPRAPSP